MEQTILTRLLEIIVYSTAIFLIVWLFRSVFSKLLRRSSSTHSGFSLCCVFASR